MALLFLLCAVTKFTQVADNPEAKRLVSTPCGATAKARAVSDGKTRV